jgi:hypothetical protein
VLKSLVQKCSRRVVHHFIPSVLTLTTARLRLSQRWDSLELRYGSVAVRFTESVISHLTSLRRRLVAIVPVLVVAKDVVETVRETIIVKNRSYYVTAKKSKI